MQQTRQFYKVASTAGKPSNSRAGTSSVTGDKQFISTQGGSNLKFVSKAEIGVLSQTIHHNDNNYEDSP